MPAKKDQTETVPVPKALWTFLVKQRGGDDAVYADFFKSQLEALVAKGWSWGRIAERAMQGGWAEWLQKQSPADFAGVARPKREPTVKKATKRKRLSPAALEKTQAAILADVAAHPGSRLGDISKRTGVAKPKAQRLLKELVAATKVAGTGEKAKRTYSLPGAEAAPAAPTKPMLRKKR